MSLAAGQVCAKDEMKRRKDPPGYPGDEAILKAFGDALRDVRIEKGLSLEEADTAFQQALKEGLISTFVPRARSRRAAAAGEAEHVPAAAKRCFWTFSALP